MWGPRNGLGLWLGRLGGRLSLGVGREARQGKGYKRSEVTTGRNRDRREATGKGGKRRVEGRGEREGGRASDEWNVHHHHYHHTCFSVFLTLYSPTNDVPPPSTAAIIILFILYIILLDLLSTKLMTFSICGTICLWVASYFLFFIIKSGLYDLL